jgi:hypothetical protein
MFMVGNQEGFGDRTLILLYFVSFFFSIPYHLNLFSNYYRGYILAHMDFKRFFGGV